MKIIFLDIDGVLNVMPPGIDEFGSLFHPGIDEFGSLFHPHFEENLREIIEKTEAKIVISSSWRISGLKFMKDLWSFRNLPGEIIDITTDVWQAAVNYKIEFLDRCERGHEIQEWLDSHKITSYVIIDDDSDMLKSQMNNFVRTSNNYHHEDHVEGYGLTKLCAKQAIQILNGKV